MAEGFGAVGPQGAGVYGQRVDNSAGGRAPGGGPAGPIGRPEAWGDQRPGMRNPGAVPGLDGSTSQRGISQHGASQHGVSQHAVTQHGASQHSVAQHGGSLGHAGSGGSWPKAVGKVPARGPASELYRKIAEFACVVPKLPAAKPRRARCVALLDCIAVRMSLAAGLR